MTRKTILSATLGLGAIFGAGLLLAGAQPASAAPGRTVVRRTVVTRHPGHYRSHLPVAQDLDRDGIRNNVDRDMDGDGVPNNRDRFPRNPLRH